MTVKRNSSYLLVWGTLLFLLVAVALTVGVDSWGEHAVTVLKVLVVVAVVCSFWLAWRSLQLSRRHRDEVARVEAHSTVLQDRLQIAHQLHDVPSHGLGAMTLRARTGAQATTVAECQKIFAELTQLSVRATQELRQLLTVLQDPDATAPLHPVARIRDIEKLVEDYETLGLVIELEGLEVSASPTVELLAYHVVQEGLKNVMRHAGTVKTRCRLTRDASWLTVEISNSAAENPPPEGTGLGQGLKMLQQRITVLGGTLAHGRHSDGGYQLLAKIPLRSPQ